MITVFIYIGKEADRSRPSDPLRVLFDGKAVGHEENTLIFRMDVTQDIRKLFRETYNTIAKLLCNESVRVIFECDPFNLNPLQSAGSRAEPLVAMLILAFPEISWDISADTQCRKDADQRTKIGLNEFSKARKHSLACTPIFDGGGLRDWVRQRIIEDSETAKDGGYLPRRTQSAIALDEETPYAFFHAYTAYRHGFRAIPITTQAQAEHWLGTNSPKQQSATIVFEDFFLNFPDGGSGYSKLWEARHNEFHQLEDISNRIFITSDQKRRCDKDKRRQNGLYLRDQRTRGKFIPPPLHKPTAGIFKLWEDSGLKRKLSWRGENGKRHRGTGELFVWPPPFRECEEDSKGHSAPGVLLVIADKLIERAEKLVKDGVSCVEEAVTGAVLATDALELLGGKTPTTSIEALRLKHEFEILAECQFAGVEYHVSMKPRLVEIRHEVRSICKWFHPDIQRRAALNAEMSILTALVRHLREYGRFDEEQTCMNRIRHLHNSLWMRYPRQAYRFVMWPVLRYLELLLSSFFTFFLIILVWVAVLSILYYYGANHPDWKMGLEDAITSFFSVGGPIDHGEEMGAKPWEFVSVTCLAIVSGFVHLGVFVSHLYSIVSRK
jgi:hypothetical protein